MIIVIRISGLVEMPSEAEETLYRLGLRRKYTAILLNDTKENRNLLSKIRNFVAYGTIDKETLKELLEKRGKLTKNSSKKPDLTNVIEGLEKKSLSSFGFKPYFRLHPPRGGINTKSHFPIKKGVLGDNKEKINDLVRRML